MRPKDLIIVLMQNIYNLPIGRLDQEWRVYAFKHPLETETIMWLSKLLTTTTSNIQIKLPRALFKAFSRILFWASWSELLAQLCSKVLVPENFHARHRKPFNQALEEQFQKHRFFSVSSTMHWQSSSRYRAETGVTSSLALCLHSMLSNHGINEKSNRER